MITADLEQRVSHVEQMSEAIQNVLVVQGARNKAEFDSVKARISALEAAVVDLKQEVAGVRREVAALPKVLAEMIAKRN